MTRQRHAPMGKKPKTKLRLCPLHIKVLPCLSCRAMKAGMVTTPKKALANRLKARKAALIRWGRLPDAEKS